MSESMMKVNLGTFTKLIKDDFMDTSCIKIRYNGQD